MRDIVINVNKGDNEDEAVWVSDVGGKRRQA